MGGKPTDTETGVPVVILGPGHRVESAILFGVKTVSKKDSDCAELNRTNGCVQPAHATRRAPPHLALILSESQVCACQSGPNALVHLTGTYRVPIKKVK